MAVFIKHSILTPVGYLILSGTSEEITEAVFSDRPFPAEPASANWIQDCTKQVETYFNHQLTQFKLPVNPSGTAFQRSVWALVSQIPSGETKTYSDIANLLGNPKLVRAVGNAIGRNPVLLLIPCHRVIGSSGSLTGYAGGLERKFRLLDHENRKPEKTTQYSLFSS